MHLLTPDEVNEIDVLWRALPADHVWSGWAAAGDAPEEVLIFRTRAHWRKFPLRKMVSGYALFDERDRCVAEESTLADLINAIEAIPGLSDPAI